MQSWRLLCGAILALSHGVALAGTATTSQPVAEVEEIFREYQTPRTPGCAVGVFERGKSVLTRGFGAADIATGRAIDGDMLFYAASMSKQFTALVIATLIQDGRVRLDDDVRRWLPELPDYGRPITVSMLLYHTSGLRDFLSLFSLAGLDRYEILDVPAVMRMVVRQRELNYVPGEQFSYTNTGYFLLAQIAERAAGEPFGDVVRKRVLAPLGMRDSYVRHGPNPDGASVAHGYVSTAAGFVVNDAYPSFGGSGGLMTSINDLRKFDHDFYRGHRVWTAKIRDLLLQPGTLTNGQKVSGPDADLYYAGGLQVGERRGQSWIAHGGAAVAFRGEYVRLPNLQASVAVLCNRGDVSPDRLVKGTLEAFHRAELQGEWPRERDRKSGVPESAKPLDTALARDLVGRYHADEIDTEYAFSLEGQVLHTIVLSPYAVPRQVSPVEGLKQLANDTLWSNGYALKLQRAADGAISGFAVSRDRVREVKFRRVE